ncbi:hypothetical protein, conserved [Eimeria tenella]|uniref:Uncharacterized protein n=1 Tax=Eimeria tenella TaxID=5802 RepID=U6KS02_EIMTE|nr:hypothetical protein, conserved [Eimeria tenella]CDJ40892.1 hypothetical protein, conserved [Eimeria tenella]|eukprot:XP_013231642.1 hypothetical protein, conserved [Eimeria tenella]
MRSLAFSLISLLGLSQAAASSSAAEAPGGPGGPPGAFFRGPFGGLSQLTAADLEAIAGRLGALGNELGDSEEPLDVAFVQRALQLLGGLLGRPEAQQLLAAAPSSNPQQALRLLLQSELSQPEDEEALLAILLYFFSLRRVLEDNSFLREQVSQLIQDNAQQLLQGNDFSKVLAAIAASNVFQDLREEVEEVMQRTTGYAPAAETNNDMS